MLAVTEAETLPFETAPFEELPFPLTINPKITIPRYGSLTVLEVIWWEEYTAKENFSQTKDAKLWQDVSGLLLKSRCNLDWTTARKCLLLTDTEKIFNFFLGEMRRWVPLPQEVEEGEPAPKSIGEVSIGGCELPTPPSEDSSLGDLGVVLSM